ncbi:MAG TPA: 3-deoxy-7-phosphoheptulonate synthase [Firmicutes bacterium]|nr:3-deoxy-7-phosphoheptulonate synthase [Bacillota bacterium]
MFEKVNRIISADEAKAIVPMTAELTAVKAERDKQLRAIIDGSDKRKVIIIGPCSADNEDAVVDYVTRLAKLEEEVKDKLMLMPRIYTEKPRTKGEGYKGMFHSPNPQTGKTDIQNGICNLRHMHIRAIRESGLTAADEMLYPDNLDYVSDFLSYIAIGARSTENQQHRLVASGIDVPVGVKNPMNGSFSVTLNSIYAAQIPNEFKYGGWQVRTTGNKYAHAVLRGVVDVYGNNIPNYHYEDVIRFYEQYLKQHLANPAIIIDTNHSNSGKNAFEQIRIAKEIFNNMQYENFNTVVKGLLVESYIEDGNQCVDGGVYGKSVTDPCLGWAKSERLIRDLAEML